MSLLKEIEDYVSRVFKTTLRVFFDALQMSPNARGYVSGSITELLLKQELESKGLEVERIREKWEGRKHPNHHGDFYIRRSGEPWFVLESKGIKSNSEKWHKIYNYDKLLKFLFKHSDKIKWINPKNDKEPQIRKWLQDNLPNFENNFAHTLYEYEDISKYKFPARETEKSRAIRTLQEQDYNREQIAAFIDERLQYLATKIKVIETHFVSGTSETNNRSQATPRKDEFSLLSVDIFLRYKEHKFLWANPLHLDSSGANAEHLQQNYIIGFVFIDDDGNEELHLSEEWSDNFEQVFSTLDESQAVLDAERQVDNR